MYDIFDANELLYSVLNNIEIKKAIDGDVYNDSRPLNSLKTDIVVNTITISQNYKPQIATSNINIYAKDLKQGVKDSKRLKEISRLVIDVFKQHQFVGKSVKIQNQTIIKDANDKEHYVNIRVQWNIYDLKQ